MSSNIDDTYSLDVNAESTRLDMKPIIHIAITSTDTYKMLCREVQFRTGEHIIGRLAPHLGCLLACLLSAEGFHSPHAYSALKFIPRI